MPQIFCDPVSTSFGHLRTKSYSGTHSERASRTASPAASEIIGRRSAGSGISDASITIEIVRAPADDHHRFPLRPRPDVCSPVSTIDGESSSNGPNSSSAVVFVDASRAWYSTCRTFVSVRMRSMSNDEVLARGIVEFCRSPGRSANDAFFVSSSTRLHCKKCNFDVDPRGFGSTRT